mgnify:CR=1 FL=1
MNTLFKHANLLFYLELLQKSQINITDKINNHKKNLYNQ